MTLTDTPSRGLSAFEPDDGILDQATHALGQLEFGCGEIRQALERLVEAYRERLDVQRKLVVGRSRLRLEMSDLRGEIARRAAEIELTREELKRTQHSLIQAEQMALLGALVAGVAHEVSTPMGVALTAASHLAEQTQTLRRVVAEGRIRKSEFDDYLNVACEAAELIETNARRAAELMHGFKQVAADQTSSERRVFNLKRHIEDVVISLRPRLRQAGHQVLTCCAETLAVDSYPGALSQVLTNLLMNSIQHAYHRGQAGILTIRVGEVDFDHVEVYYADDGRGIPPDHRRLIFDPFFTTRRDEGGTGLGLYIVNTIITDTLKGSIALEPLDQGTAFRVRFPRVLLPREAP